MLDFSNIQKYRENNRVEAKKAAGGLPRSIWETYSAFANTIGGIILLGAEELPDHSLRPIDLPHAEEMVTEFWNTINNPKKVNVNILSDKHVQIIETDGCRIIAITVPRAIRQDKPVYIDGNPMTGTYRRNGEGDYRCTPDAVQAMIRDAAAKAQDMVVLEEFDLSALDMDSLRRYRIRMKSHRPGHVWEEVDDVEFLYKLGAVGRGEDGEVHPTAAGLLMFGHE
ncbi:AlbA family DNA-binding domain-containing protein, partial [Paenibacillus sp.]